MTRKAVIYCRISRDRPDVQGERKAAGVKRQEADCRTLLGVKGCTLVHDPFVDNDVSAYSGKPRPAYRDMVKMVEADGVEAIVVWHMDRLYRSNNELEELISLTDKHALSILSVTGDSMDLTTSDGQMVARILAAVARKSSDDTRRRVKAAKAKARAEGRWLGGGRRPYGYRVVKEEGQPARHEVDGDEAHVIKEVARRIIQGEPVTRVAVDLNRRGVPTAGGDRWRPTHLKRLLQKPHLAGLLPDGRQGSWPGIITPDQHKVLVGLLANEGKPTGRPGARKYALVGLVYCGRCGTKMHGSAEFYRCDRRDGGCGVSITAPKLELHVLERLFHERRTMLTAHKGQDPGPGDDEILRQMGKLEDERDSIAESLGEGRIALRIAEAASQRIDARIRELQGKLSAKRARAHPETPERILELTATMYDRWANRWEGIDPKRAEFELNKIASALAGVIDTVRISPKKPGADFGDRVEIAWKA